MIPSYYFYYGGAISMGNNRKKNKVYSLFENTYKIGLFYKPSMQIDDVYYYVELDNTIRLMMKLVDETILIIHDIIPLTNAYLVKFYDSFIKFLITQKEFTILISKIGNTSCVDEACIKSSIPIVDDNRFLSVPERLYNRLKELNGGDATKYGFYLVAVSDDTEFDPDLIQSVSIQDTENNQKIIEIEKSETVKPAPIEIPKKEEPVVEETPKSDKLIDKFLHYLTKRYRTKLQVVSTEDGIYTISISDIVLSFKDMDGIIVITECDAKQGCCVSSIIYLSIFEFIEKFKLSDVVIDNVTNGMVFSVCKTKSYKKIGSIKKTLTNNFGSYLIK